MTTANRLKAAARAVMEENVCGLMIDGERVFCDDPRAEPSPDKCQCKATASAALLAADAASPARSEYDAKLGKITAEDREYAAELLHDIEPGLTHGAQTIENVAQWFRKVRYEAVMADRKRAASPASGGEIDRENEQFNQGVTHTVELLAKAIGVEDWVAGDGSEDYDNDLQQTLMNILTAKGLYDPETGAYAALSASPAPAVTEEEKNLENRDERP